jgi:hypothetical protein
MSIVDYQEQIEKYFSNKVKERVDLSIVDRDAVACWREHDIPLKLVLEGIDSAFLFAAASGETDRKILFLYQCHRYVLESWFEQKVAKFRQTQKNKRDHLLRFDDLSDYIDRVISIFNTARFKAEQKRNFSLIDLLDRNYKNLMSIKDIFFNSSGLNIDDLKLALWEIEWDLNANIVDISNEKEVEETKNKIKANLRLSSEDLKIEKKAEDFNRLVCMELRKIYKLYPFVNLFD